MGVHERATTSPRSRPRALAVAVLALLGGAVTTAPAAEGGAAPVPPPVPAPLVVRDLRYGPAPEHLADLHLPTAGGNRGVIVLVHGGGFVRGSRGELFRTAAPLVRQLDRGFALVDVEYRLTDGERHTFPDAVRDVSRAVEWVRRHGRRHGLDPSTVIVAGASAGGTIATLVGVGTNPTPGTRLPRTPRVDGWVAVSGIHDFAERARAPPASVPPGSAATRARPRWRTPRRSPTSTATTRPATWCTATGTPSFPCRRRCSPSGGRRPSAPRSSTTSSTTAPAPAGGTSPPAAWTAPRSTVGSTASPAGGRDPAACRVGDQSWLPISP